MKIKPIAIHLPQFHPFPENDEWWGKGFTEWTNVTKAKPLFPGHYQPHLPADLGFYDLRLEEARLAQIALAKEYGIYGFCYYHYWFNGKRLMHEPLDRMLANKKEDFPFMLCWANENWTRRWDGIEEVLIEQKYSESDNEEHIKFLCEHFFSDKRYIKINNKPFISIYRPNLIPNIKKLVEFWDKACKKFGFNGIYIAYMMTEGYSEDPKNIGFDASIEFKPDFHSNPIHKKENILKKILSKLNLYHSPYSKNQIIEYRSFVEHQLNLNPVTWKNFKGITPMWDNSARRKLGSAFILANSTPSIYQFWLEELIKLLKNSDDNDAFIFINAWNEWAEGNHLEPCSKWGLAYLEATKKALDSENAY
ncbi:glycoside hydrolase family 99-like domain-containing protein [Pedobacter agri]|uniref:glycosyltransferase WbsX family protein n=1 Tax=Pedobacter agri TaxID=454586 RepID=UPI00292EBFC0|nr:glycoside hydrolase family 99-like domain-containing protein [Pedobacter agri]